jgi:hypothetical protein
MEGMTPSGISLSGNVPLRLEGISYGARAAIIGENILGQKSTGRIGIEGIENAHLGLSVPDERMTGSTGRWRDKNGALQRVVGLYS